MENLLILEIHQKIMLNIEIYIQSSENETDYIRKAYEYVRDNISHSADAGEDEVTCSAGEVFEAGHGIFVQSQFLQASVIKN